MMNDKVILNVYSFWFNRSFAVSSTIDSLRDCKTDLIRFIFVDDCSTDETYKNLIDQCSFLKNKIVFSNDKNIGFSNTLDESISKWQKLYPTKYIAILGAGDKVLPERFERQIKFLEKNDDYGLVSCKYNVESENGHVFQSSKFHGDIDQGILLDGPKWTHGAVMYRSSVFLASGGYNRFFHYCQDWDLYVRILNHSKGFVLNEMLYVKKAFNDGASYNPTKRFEQLKYSYIVIKSLRENKKASFESSIINDKVFVKRLRITLIKLLLGRQFYLLSKWELVIKSNYKKIEFLDMKILIVFSKLYLSIVEGVKFLLSK